MSKGLLDIMKLSNINFMEVAEGKKGEKGPKSYLKKQ